MRIKLLQIGTFFIRFDLKIFKDRNDTLLGFNYCEGGYRACTDQTLTECMDFEFAEFQIGFIFFTIAFGKEYPVTYE